MTSETQDKDHTSEDQARTEQAKRVVKDYAQGLRELLRKLRERLH